MNMKIKELQNTYEDCVRSCVESTCEIHSHRVFLYKRLGRYFYQRFAAGPITDACFSIKKLKASNAPQFAISKGINRVITRMYCVIAARMAYRVVLALIFRGSIVEDDHDDHDDENLK